MVTTDAAPYAETPDGKLDLCIERLGLSPQDALYPLNTGNWPGDEQTWREWEAFIATTYANGRDVSSKPVRIDVLRELQKLPLDKLPYYDFKIRKPVKRA